MAEIDIKHLDEQSIELFGRFAKGDPTGREDLVVLYHPLAEYLARRFTGRGEPVEDLSQVASIALLKAIDRFDVGREVKFSTYAVPTIVGELKRHFRDKGWAVHVPRRLQELGLLVRSVITEAAQELGHAPTVAEIAKRAGIEEAAVLEAMDTAQAYSADSLDATPEVDERRPAAQLATTDESFELVEGWTSVAPHLRALPERERLVIYYRFVAQMTQSQIADRLGISQMHVSRLLSQTLQRLRRLAERDVDT